MCLSFFGILSSEHRQEPSILTRFDTDWCGSIAAADVFAAMNVRLGENYPLPIVDHRTARERSLGAFAVVKG